MDSASDGDSVQLINAPGPAMFEINRLCTASLRVDVANMPFSPNLRCLAMLCYSGVRRNDSADSQALLATAVRYATDKKDTTICQVLSVSFEDASGARRDEESLVEHFNLTSAHQRLALLARLAVLARRATGDGRRATGDGRRATGDGSEFAMVSLYWQVASIQRGFSLQLTERELSNRLGISPSTLRRWFHRAGSLAPERFMQWVRMYEVASRLAGGKSSAAQVAQLLGFEHLSAVRRTMRQLVSMPLVTLRSSVGQEAFLQQMMRELSSAAPIRSRMLD